MKSRMALARCFLAMQAVESVNKKTISEFTKEHIEPSSTVHTDVFCSKVALGYMSLAMYQEIQPCVMV